MRCRVRVRIKGLETADARLTDSSRNAKGLTDASGRCCGA